MMNLSNIDNFEYKNWLTELKSNIRSVQVKAAVAVNSALIELYWELGKMISEKQTQWGTQFLENLSIDLKSKFPEMQGFSTRNLKYIKQFYLFYTNAQIGKQAVAQIPWGNIFSFTEVLPDDLKSSLPTIEEIELKFEDENN